MKIIKIDLFQLDIPLRIPMVYPHKTYHSLDDTIIRIETDANIVGWGEVCPLSTTYQPAHASGIRADLSEIAPGLIGEDPTQIDKINATMDNWLLEANYAKSAIDIACWDITGKAFNRPVFHILGGRMQKQAKAYPSIGISGNDMEDLDEIKKQMIQYRAEGFTHFQLKVGRNSSVEADIARIRTAGAYIRPGEYLVADANRAWKTHEAIRVLRLTEEIDFYIEQPCSTYEECLSIRRQVRQPMILDESLTDIRILLRGLADDLFEGVGCKISRVGGITGMRLIRDVCKAAGKVMTVDDSWGSDLSAAAQAHLSISTPIQTFFSTYISTYFSDIRYDLEAPHVVNGFINALEKPGLGVNPDMAVLGEPVMAFS